MLMLFCANIISRVVVVERSLKWTPCQFSICLKS